MVPQQCGWRKENSAYEFYWFDGPQWAPRIEDVIVEGVTKNGTYFL